MIIHFNDTELDVVASDDSYRRRAVKDKTKLVLYYSLTHHVEIPVGAWVEYEGEVFTLEKASNFTKNSSRDFSYTLTLEYDWSRSEKYKVKNPVDGRLKFSYTAKPHEFIQLLVDNMNMRESGWAVGECVDAVEQVVSFNHVYCSDALSMIADAFETEWEVVGKTINLRKVEYFKDNPLPLSYGKGNGFKTEISRTNQDGSRAVEILYVQGGTENINPSKYGSSELLLPKSQELEYEGRIYVSSADGLYITRKGKEPSSKVEDSLDCSSISPKRIGEVSAVVVVDDTKHFYDFIDSSIPIDLNFAECLMEGETMTVIFQSGMLAGKEFEVKYYHEAKSGKAARRFEIVPQDIDGQTMPNDIFKPAVWDKYAVFHISLPDAYVCNNSDKSGASWDMFREAARYFYEHEGELFTFKGALDGIWAKKDWLNIGGRIKPGAYVLFSDEQFHPEGSLVRMTEVKDFVNNPHYPVIELSNAPVTSAFQNTMHKVSENEVLLDDKHREALQFTKRRFRDSRETLEMLKDAMLENFTESISPLAVQAMMMLIGDESLQFRFVDSMTAPSVVAHNVTYDATTKVLKVPAGIIQHFTLGIDTISASHAVSEYKFWELPSFETPPLTEDGQRYYVYAKVSTTDQTGVFYISDRAIGMDSVDGFYHLLMGLLNSEYDGDRSFVSLYGFTEILPGRVTTDKIVSTDGKTYFDLSRGEIGGNIALTASEDYKKIENGLKNLEVDLDAVKTQSDKEYTIWFYNHAPALNNLPASKWDTDDVKAEHDQDMFYNSDTGFAYRFEQNEDGSYSWNNITDHQTVKALENAAKAQNTADGKKRVFVSTPYPPYDVGDLWLTGGSADGELKKCITARVDGSYTADDWVVGVSYDNTKTTINGGIVTSGTVQLAGDDKNIKTGITGVGTDDTSVRIWAGDSYANRTTAPYRVLQNGSMIAEAGIIGGWSITKTGIVSGELSQNNPSGGTPSKNRTSLNADGTIGGNLLNVGLDAGKISCSLWDDPVLEWSRRYLTMHARVSVPFLSTNFGTQNGGKLYAERMLMTQLSYENSNFHIQSIYDASGSSPGIGYFQLPTNLEKYNGVTLRIFNDIEQSGSYKYNTAGLVYNSTDEYIPNINTSPLRNFLGKYTGNKLLIPSGKMAVITGVAVQRADTTNWGKRELAWYVEVTA